MKNRFLSNILLTFVWVVLTGDFHFANYLFGFIVSYIILMVITRGSGKAKYFTIVPKLIFFVLFFLKELVKANLEVAWEVMTPKLNMTPGIVKVPLTVQSDVGITLLANMITLTPGTLSLDVSNDKKVLYVHAMYIKDKEKFIAGIKNGFEKRILEILK
ncbi:MAG: Na+/H+ antiporter subunit E [Zunongwangia sp.]|uniref:Na+/H+ antiporter subunit E n=1 Tax=Zunongwangia profunda TaxID=398743 RepID=UPI0005A301D8|nr:Na+/H+ antiporter subunit E [Zunongwangia profunda]MAG86588.1 Na+/H+ antiporter subunit E [Flavobacteriaceae bacterium]MAO37656.1 Na+/H+ antiporter subunit E [Zunongwangia sp.]MAS71653.1 Na+/H+ antiporter subunit E [Zunongwangia sp.]HAJ83042.1 Na+/H+ antiporter subunit E [Zunongwangia profunda]|tara:strand:- start:1239 stop:1715 length:477 start_codon:yes stop_codon:yes gene_type:complete